jgi:hypothetical protein
MIKPIARVCDWFQISSNGTYRLDVRLIHWNGTQDGWIWSFSPRVSLPVNMTNLTSVGGSAK